MKLWTRAPYLVEHPLLCWLHVSKSNRCLSVCGFVIALFPYVHLYVCVPVVPTVLVANKADLEIGREVTTEEGQTLAKELRFVCPQ